MTNQKLAAFSKKQSNNPLPAGQVWGEVKPQYWYEWGNEPKGRG